MFGRHCTVYRSKDKEDWERARALLEQAQLKIRCWCSEELPVGGCGSKIDIREVASGREVPRTIYHIEVTKSRQAEARAVLEGKVLPMKSYGSALL